MHLPGTARIDSQPQGTASCQSAAAEVHHHGQTQSGYSQPQDTSSDLTGSHSRNIADCTAQMASWVRSRRSSLARICER